MHRIIVYKVLQNYDLRAHTVYLLYGELWIQHYLQIFNMVALFPVHSYMHMQFGGQSNVIAMYRSCNIAQFSIKVAIFQ